MKLGPSDDPNGFSSGVFDFADARNPLADYSFVFVPYCTGDVHLGNATHVYGPELTVQHKGSIDASTALKALAEQFPTATELVVAGESAGSVPTPLYAGLAHDLLPNAAITVLADGSGAYPDLPAHQHGDRAGMGHGERDSTLAGECRPDRCDVELAGVVRAGPQARSRDHLRPPRLRLRRGATVVPRLLGVAVDSLISLIDGNETQIEQARRRPPELHRAGNAAHRAEQSRLLHRDRRRRSAGRLGQ